VQIHYPLTVVIDGLIGIQLRRDVSASVLHEMRPVNAYHKRVSLADKDLDLIHNQWLNVGSFHLDYGQQVVVDGKYKIWFAGNGNKAETVPTMQRHKLTIFGRAGGAHLFPCSTFTIESAVAGPPG
jgi:hypothetical protein